MVNDEARTSSARHSAGRAKIGPNEGRALLLPDGLKHLGRACACVIGFRHGDGFCVESSGSRPLTRSVRTIRDFNCSSMHITTSYVRS
jgi:hypothetical protein